MLSPKTHLLVGLIGMIGLGLWVIWEVVKYEFLPLDGLTVICGIQAISTFVFVAIVWVYWQWRKGSITRAGRDQ